MRSAFSHILLLALLCTAVAAQAESRSENISAPGFTEDKVKIGDRFRIGKALVEVAQGRQPCWKQPHSTVF